MEIHLNAFKGFFLASLGRQFLLFFYKTCLKFEDNTIGVGAFKNEKLIGFAIGSLNSTRYYSKLIRRHKLKYFLLGIKLFFTKPIALFRILRNLNKANPENKMVPTNSELLSIGVLKDYRGLGVGKILIDFYENQAFTKGANFVSLTTDKLNNDKVKQFYYSQGYEVFNEFTAYPDRQMIRYLKKL